MTSSDRSTTSRPPRELLNVMSRCAHMYYMENKTQKEIADLLGISRNRVRQLLAQAKELEVVQISIYPARASEELEHGLRERFGLFDAIVVES